MNMTMVCSYRYFCLELPLKIVDCQVEGLPLILHRVCQGEYVILYDIDFEGGERKILQRWY